MGMLPHIFPAADEPSPTGIEPPRAFPLLKFTSGALRKNLKKGKGLSAKSVTHVNSDWKDRFAGICFRKSSGSLVQIYFSFMAETLENHNTS